MFSLKCVIHISYKIITLRSAYSNVGKEKITLRLSLRHFPMLVFEFETLRVMWRYSTPHFVLPKR